MKKLTKSEEELMHLIWALGSASVGQIRSSIAEKSGKKPPHSTISTMMGILKEKGFLSFEDQGRLRIYTPTISKKDYSQFSLKNLVGAYFGGSTKQLVSFLVQENDLSLAEIAEILSEEA